MMSLMEDVLESPLPLPGAAATLERYGERLRKVEAPFEALPGWFVWGCIFIPPEVRRRGAD